LAQITANNAISQTISKLNRDKLNY